MPSPPRLPPVLPAEDVAALAAAARTILKLNGTEDPARFALLREQLAVARGAVANLMQRARKG